MPSGLNYLSSGDDNIYAASRLGSSFANMANNLAELRYRNAVQQRRDALDQQYLMMAQEQAKRKAAVEAFQMDEMKKEMAAREQLAGAYGKANDPMLRVPGGMGPPNPQDVARQEAARSGAFLMGGNPSAVQRSMEPMTFPGGSTVYSGGPVQQPMMQVPMLEQQRQQLNERARVNSLREFEQKRQYAMRVLALKDRIRHEKEMELNTRMKADPFGIEQRGNQLDQPRSAAPGGRKVGETVTTSKGTFRWAGDGWEPVNQ